MYKHDCELERCSCTIPLFSYCKCCEQKECNCKECDICESEQDTQDLEEEK